MKQKTTIFLLFISLCMILSGCLSATITSKNEKFNEAVNLLNSAENAADCQNVIEILKGLGDYEGIEEKIQEAENKSDEYTLTVMLGDWSVFKNGQNLLELCEDLYNRKNAEIIKQWVNFQYELSNYYNSFIKEFRKTLKNPNSFTDIGSTYTYKLTKSDTENTLIVSEYTLTLRYTATNSFGGAIQDSFTLDPFDWEYKYENTDLSADELSEILLITDFQNLYHFITEK